MNAILSVLIDKRCMLPIVVSINEYKRSHWNGSNDIWFCVSIGGLCVEAFYGDTKITLIITPQYLFKILGFWLHKYYY